MRCPGTRRLPVSTTYHMTTDRKAARAATVARLLAQARKEFAMQGGQARAKAYTKEELSAMARKGAEVRWAKYRANKKAGPESTPGKLG